MRKLKESLKIKAKKIVGVAIWALVVFLLFSAIKNINRVASIRKSVQAEELRVEKMKQDNAQLEAQVAMMQGSDFIEKEIRDKLGLAKEGESVVVLPSEDLLRKLAPQMPVEEDALPDPNWKKWMKLFAS